MANNNMEIIAKTALNSKVVAPAIAFGKPLFLLVIGGALRCQIKYQETILHNQNNNNQL